MVFHFWKNEDNRKRPKGKHWANVLFTSFISVKESFADSENSR